VATYTDELAIGAPPEQVWAVLSDVERWPLWTASMTSVKLVGPGPLAVGVAVRVHQPRLPALTWTVDELVPGRLFTWSSRSAGTASRAEHEVVPSAGGCRVTLTLVQSGPLAGVAALGYGRLTRRYLRMELEGLRSQVSGTHAIP